MAPSGGASKKRRRRRDGGGGGDAASDRNSLAKFGFHQKKGRSSAAAAAAGRAKDDDDAAVADENNGRGGADDENEKGGGRKEIDVLLVSASDAAGDLEPGSPDVFAAAAALGQPDEGDDSDDDYDDDVDDGNSVRLRRRDDAADRYYDLDDRDLEALTQQGRLSQADVDADELEDMITILADGDESEDDEEEERCETTNDAARRSFPAPREARKRREQHQLRQPTLTQLGRQLEGCPDRSLPRRAVSFSGQWQDTDDMVYLDKGGESMITYKKHETWQSSALRGVYYHILEFKWKGCGRKLGKCEVYRDLRHTFLGVEESELLVNDSTWRRHCRQDNVKNFGYMAKVSDPIEANLLDENGMIELRKLNRPCRKLATQKPTPMLEWNSCGAQYHNTYTFCSPPIRPVSPATNRKPVVLDLFAGCGGMSLGLAEAGFDVKYMVENNSFAADALRINHDKRHAIIYQQDVNTFLRNAKEAADRKGFTGYPKRDGIDHIHASPPCKGFSLINAGGKDDISNNNLTFAFVDAVELYRPRTATFENVTGMLSTDDNAKRRGGLKCNRSYLQRLIRRLVVMDYQVRVTVLDASDYGDAQNRKRVVLFAARHGVCLPDVPAPTHRDNGNDGLERKRVVDDEDVLGNLADIDLVSEGEFVIIPNEPRRIYDHFPSEQCFAKALGTARSEKQKLVKGSRAGTILCKKPVEHYCQERVRMRRIASLVWAA